MMNNVSLIGRLTKDPELRYTSGKNTAVASFTIAVNRDIKVEGQPEADFIPIVAWAKTAEFAQKYFQKGQQIALTGRIQTRTWDDDEKNRHYVTEVVADRLFFADSKKNNEQASEVSDAAEPPPNNQPQGGYQQPNNPPPAAGANQQTAASGSKKPWER